MASSENNTWKEEYQERDKKSKGIAEPVQSSLMVITGWQKGRANKPSDMTGTAQW